MIGSAKGRVKAEHTRFAYDPAALRYLVTGAAGFIGSQLCDALLATGRDVVGVDCFVPYYPRPIKERNLAGALASRHFTFLELDLRRGDLTPALDGVSVVFHLAAMGGLLRSWQDFDLYLTCNVQATQRLLEAIRTHGRVEQLIHASTSSIYGAYATGPETIPAEPVSPYGITKLAAEHLVKTYDRQFGLPATILRYYSVYGPRQRPDMGYHIFVDRILTGRPITIAGDGNQLRGSTYVADIVRGTILAHERFERGSIYNLGGSDEASANEVIDLLEDLIGRPAIREYGPARPGEQARSLADTSLAQARLGFAPSTPLREGLAAQVEWQRNDVNEVGRPR